MNPWCTIGGVATTVCQPNEFIIPDSAVVGDVLVLTKPLGTQVKFLTLSSNGPNMSGIQETFPKEQISDVCYMTRNQYLRNQTGFETSLSVDAGMLAFVLTVSSLQLPSWYFSIPTWPDIPSNLKSRRSLIYLIVPSSQWTGCRQCPPVVGPAGEVEPDKVGRVWGGRPQSLPAWHGFHGQAQQDRSQAHAQVQRTRGHRRHR